jgi:hypothetical protein
LYLALIHWSAWKNSQKLVKNSWGIHRRLLA